MIVIADKLGQLGNRLFQFAHVIAFAAEHGSRVAHPGFQDYAADFPAFARDPWCQWPPRRNLPGRRHLGRSAFRQTDRLLTILRRSGGRLGPLEHVEPGSKSFPYSLDSPEFLSLARRRGLLLVTGWAMRDDLSFHRHAGLLRGLFEPARSHTESARTHVSGARRDCDVLVGLHVRRGDYADFHGGRFFWSASEYASIVTDIHRLYPNRRVSVLACSDDSQLLRELEPVVSAGPGTPLGDLTALSLCDLIVGPPSTFSAWAAFYGHIPLKHLERSDEALTLEGFQTYEHRSQLSVSLGA